MGNEYKILVVNRTENTIWIRKAKTGRQWKSVKNRGLEVFTVFCVSTGTNGDHSGGRSNASELFTALKHYGREFESHSRRGCLRLSSVCVVLCR